VPPAAPSRPGAAPPAAAPRGVSTDTKPYRTPGARGRLPRTSDAGAPPAKAGRGPVFWVGMGCGGCLLVVLLVVGGGAAFFYYSTSGPVDAVRAEVQQLHAGQLDAAHARLSAAYGQEVTREALAAFVARHPSLKENADSTFLNRSLSNDTATLSGYLTAASGAREVASFALVKEGGEWRIARMEVAADHPEAVAAASPTGLRFDQVDVRKSLTADGNVEVRFSINVAGFDVRPEGSQYAMDLTLDVETTGPTGERVEALTRDGVLRVQRPTSLARGAVAPIETALTLDREMPPGGYAVTLRIHDGVGGGQAVHRATVTIP
jgi:hypothetical protein